jgi:photosynthetic reaction center H subunit
MPAPKTFKLRGGATYQAPPGNAELREIRTRAAAVPGSPMQPTGDPMLDAVGPASYAERHNTPDVTSDGHPMIVPLRAAEEFSVAAEDADPRGMLVIAADGIAAGKVTDIWVDRAEPQIRYLEVALLGPTGGGRTVMLPIGFARINKGAGRINVVSILAHHFATVPAIASPNQITRLEEDRITGYYAGGHLYATPSRLGPIL